MTSPRPKKQIVAIRIRRDLLKGKKPAEIALDRNVSVGYVYALRARLKKEVDTAIDNLAPPKDTTFIADLAPSGIMGLVEPVKAPPPPVPEEPVLVATLVDAPRRRMDPEIAGVVGVVVTLVLLAAFLWITTR